MSLIEPKIDELLDIADNDRFLLCSIASKRARDINDMMCGQRKRAAEQQLSAAVARASERKPLSLAFEEIEMGDISYDPDSVSAR